MRLADFIKSLDATEDPSWALIDSTIATAAERSPELAAAIRFCAIPRRFDAETIGVLRGAPDDRQRNAELLEALLEHPFVRPRETGGFVYHDSVRLRLLDDWRSEARRAELEELTWRLVRHHEEAHARVGRAEDHAWRVHKLVARANPSRFLAIASAIGKRLLEPLLEALEQLALVSAETAYDYLVYHLLRLEDQGRFTACRVLVAGARDAILPSAGETERPRIDAWLRYWDGRALVRLERPREAELRLAPLAEASGDDTRLRCWALDELGQAQRQLWKLKDALATFERSIALVDATEADAENLAFSYLRLGDLYVLLERPQRGAEVLQEALAAAERVADAAPVVWALSSLAEAERRLGRRREALEHALTALDLARTELRDRWAPHEAVGNVLAALAAERPELLATAMTEGEAVVASLDDPVRLLRRRIDRLRLLHRNGRLERADAMLPELERDLEKVGTTQIRAQANLEIAQLHERRGRLAEAESRLRACEEASRRGGVLHVAADAIQHRGRVLARLGRWEGAGRDFADAEQLWIGHGHDRLAALARAEGAVAALRGGDAEGAEAALVEAGEELADASPELRGHYLEVRARHETSAGRYGQADAADEERIALYDARQKLPEAAAARAGLAARAASRGRWDIAEQAARRAAETWALVAARDAYRRPEDRRAADRANAEGVRCLLGDDPSNLVSAREQLETALNGIDEPWYRLNLAYAAGATGDWADAAGALARALADAPWLACDALERRLAHYHLARDQALLDLGEHEAAAAAFDESRARLDRPSQREARERCMLGRGDSLRALGDQRGAAQAYREVLAGGRMEAAPRLGEVLVALGERDAAIEALRRGVESSAGDVAAESAARLLDLLGGAAPDRDAVIVAVREHAGAAGALALGERLAARAQRAPAERAFALAEPELPEAALSLAHLHRELADAAAAAADYTRAIRSGDDATASVAAAELGSLLREQGDRAGAAAAFRAANAGARRSPGAAIALAEMLVEDGDPAGAESALRLAIAAGERGSASRAHVLLGDVLRATARPEQAAESYRRALTAADPDAAAEAAFRLLGERLDEEAARDEVLAAVMRCGAKAGLELGNKLARNGAAGAAEQILAQAADLVGDLYAPDAALAFGDLLAAKGDRPAALLAYRRALHSEDAFVVPEAALRLVDAGEPEEKAVDPLIEDGGLPALRLGRLLAERGDRAAAERALRAVAGTPGPFAASASVSLGELLADAGEEAQAVAAYRQAAESTDASAAATAGERLARLDGPPEIRT